MQPVPRTPMPAPRWMKLPEGRIGTSFDGLSDPSSEIAYFDGREDERASRSLMSSGEGLNIVAFEEEDELTVDEDTASWIIWHEYDGLRQRVSDGEFTPVAAAQYLLRYGAVRISRGKVRCTIDSLNAGRPIHVLALTTRRRCRLCSPAAVSRS